jgi:tetratricopeptide (TPR) repeat protein
LEIGGTVVSGRADKTVEALLECALNQEQEGRLEGALMLFDEIAARTGGVRTIEERRCEAKALWGQGRMSHRLGRVGEHDSAVEAMLLALRREDDAEVLLTLGRGLYAMSKLAMVAQRWDDALRVLEAVIGRLENAATPELRQEVALALMTIALPLAQLGCDEEVYMAPQVRVIDEYAADALAVYERLADQHAHEPGPGSRAMWASSIFNRASVLAELGRIDEAAEGFAEVIRQFENDEDEDVQVSVAQARRQAELLRS